MVEEKAHDFLLTEKSKKNGEEYRKNVEWLDEHFEEKRKKYSGQIAIVLDQDIWEVAKTPSEVHNKLRNLSRGKKLQAHTEYLPEEGTTLLF